MVAPSENEDLPRANVKRLIKNKLTELARAQFNQDRDIPVQKEASLAVATGARIFVHYLSATAYDVCRESKRQTINAEDVMKALEDIEFKELIPSIRNALEAFRKDNELKKSIAKKNGPANKRKAPTPKDSSRAAKPRNGGEGPAKSIEEPEQPENVVDVDEEDEDSMQAEAVH